MKINIDEIVRMNFPLPFYIPIEEGNQIIRDYEDFATFKFTCKKVKNDSFKAIAETEEFCTQIKMEFSFNKEGEIEKEDLMRRAIFSSLIFLNNFLDSFRLVNNFNFIRNFTITDLPPIIEIEIATEKINYVTSPTTIAQDKIPLNLEQLKKTQSRLSAWDSHKYFEVIDKFLSKGIHHLYTEEFLFAIVELQTSFESYIRLCHYLILNKQGADEVKIEAAKEFPLKNTIIDHIGRALGENFDFNDNTTINNWYEKLYKLRNNIVHSGLSYISGEQAYDAYDSLEAVVKYINNLMIVKGFMEIDGKVEISQLNKNISENVDFDKVKEKLKQKGLIE